MIYVEELSLEEYKDVLSELHGYILKIALEIKRVCDKNNIKYFILGGTLLGAVRHKGFIPWDDDLDIGMLREDYERFIRICPRELGDDFQIMTFENERKFALPYSKVQMKNTAFIEKNAPMYTCGNGIYVDVGPVDKIPDSEIRKKIFGIRSMFLRYALTKKCGYEDSTPEVTIKKRIGRLYAKLHSKENLINKSNHVVTRYNNKATKQYYVTGSAYRFGKEVIPVESLTGDLPEYPFEGIMLKGPKNPEVILEMLYGDYMALPPEDKRYNRHGTIAVDFHHSAT